MKYLKCRILAPPKKVWWNPFTGCIAWKNNTYVRILNVCPFFFALEPRESQTWNSPGAVESVSHLDGVAADSCGSSEASALLTRQHKQLGEPLLHQTGEALVLSLQAAVVHVLDHFKAEDERKEVVTWFRGEGRLRGGSKKEMAFFFFLFKGSWTEQRKGRRTTPKIKRPNEPEQLAALILF